MAVEDIGMRIDTMIHERGLTGAGLARACGVTRATVGEWRHGRNLPSVSLLPAICEYLSVSADELLGFESVEEGRIDHAVAMWSSCDAPSRYAILAAVVDLSESGR